MLGIGLGLWRGQTIVRRWDEDALAYIVRTEIADGQTMETKVRLAINQFVLQCKRDASPDGGRSNWEALQNVGLLAGPRTLNGALLALKGGNPTNFNFVSGDYNATTGLKGNGVNKALEFLDTVNSPVYGQNFHHLSVYVTSTYQSLNNSTLISYAQFGGRRSICYVKSPEAIDPNQVLFRLANGYSAAPSPIDMSDEDITGFMGATRAASFPTNQVRTLVGNEDIFSEVNTPSEPLDVQRLGVFRYAQSTNYTNARISFYSGGYAADLIKLRAAAQNYMEAIS